MPQSNKKDVDYIRMLNDDDFNEKKQELQEVINEYLNWFDKSCPIEQGNNNKNSLLKINFESKNKEGEHNNILIIIVKLAKLLAHLRGTVNVWNTEKTQGSNYGYSTPTIEEPDRAMTQLLNLAKGHALSQGRKYLTLEDIPLLIKVVLSTATIERVMVFDLLLAYNGTMTTSQLEKSLGIAKATALKTMLELNILGLVSGNHFDTYDEDEYDNSRLTSIHDRSSNNEKKIITLNKDFEWFLSDEFKGLREGFIPDGKSRYDSKRDVEVDEKDESVKKNSPHIQQKKLLEDVQYPVTPSIMQSPLAAAALSSPLPTQQPMLPSPPTLLSLPILIRPLTSLPLQTILKQDKVEAVTVEEEILPIPINKHLDYTYNQDKVLEDNALLVTTITATAINSSVIKNKK
jgi:hypothetical protein